MVSKSLVLCYVAPKASLCCKLLLTYGLDNSKVSLKVQCLFTSDQSDKDKDLNFSVT